ncbi:tubulin-like doman-containing protein [Thermococcus sp.]
MIQFPEMVMGIGGAGKNLVFEILNTDWLIKELLQNSERKYYFLVVDTAEGEYKIDKERAENAKKKIDRMAEELETHSNIEVNVKCIISDLNIDREVVLYTKNLIESLHRRKYIKVWWIYDPDKGVDNREGLQKYKSSGFSKGTVRRRGVTKAMFYKALVDGRIDDIFMIRPGIQEIAMIVGLGGGTGSGLFIDLANRIKLRNPGVQIVLFGILPTLREGNNERANAYIALSELEYLKLTQGRGTDSLFSHVVLTTIEPTGFGGAGDAYKEKPKALEEFSQMFPYLLVNFYDAKSGNFSDIFEGGYYGRFILAAGGIVRYEVESTINNKKILEDAINSLTNALMKEHDIRNENIGKIIKILKDNHFIDIITEETEFYSRYLEYIKNQRLLQEFYGFLTNPVMQMFNYNSPRSIIEGIDTRILMGGQSFSEKVNSLKDVKEIREFIHQLKSAIDSSKPDSYKDDIDKMIGELALKILENIETSLEQLSTFHRFLFPPEIKAEYGQYEKEVGQMLRDLTTFDIRPSQISNLDELRRLVSTDITKKERQLQSLEIETENIKREMSEIEEQVAKTIELTSRQLNEYYEIIKLAPSLEGKLRESSRKINNMLEDLRVKITSERINKNLEPESLARSVNEEFDLAMTNMRTIINQLSSIFPSDPDIHSLKNFLEYLNLVKNTMLHYYGYMYYTYRQEHRSFSEKITGKDYSTQISDYENEYDSDITGRIRFRDFFKYVNIITDEEGGIENVQMSRIYDVISTIIKRIFDNIQLEISNNLGNKLNIEMGELNLQELAEGSQSSREFITKVKDVVYEKTIEKRGLSEKLKEIEEEKAKLNQEMLILRDFYDILSKMLDMVADLSVRIQKEWHDEIDRYHRSIKKLKKYLEEKASKRQERGTFIYKVQPSPEALGLILDVFNSNLSLILQNPSLSHLAQIESRKIMNAFKELFSTLLYPNYLGLQRGRAIVEDEWTPIEWSVPGSMVYVSSPINETPGEMNQQIKEAVIDILRRTLHPGREPYYVPLAAGSSWDIATTIFVPGVFLENIYGLYQINGSFYDAYYSLKTSGERREIFHHIYKLEDGWYIERVPMDPDEAIKYAADELANKDVTTEIVKKYYIKHSILPED